MISKKLSINNFKYNSIMGFITGITDDGIIDYYSGQTMSDAYVTKIPILLTQSIDDIGFYTPYINEWTPLIEYEIGARVIYNNECYICIGSPNISRYFNMIYWERAMVIDRKSWKQNTIYRTGDEVIYNGRTFKCKRTHTGGLNFKLTYWIQIDSNQEVEYNITITGESKIDMFRRFGKTEIDQDLYNSNSNTLFNKPLIDSSGLFKQITGEKDNSNSLTPQPLYSYKTYLLNEDSEEINVMNYSDISNGLSKIEYKSRGLSYKNSINASNFKLDYLIGVVDSPKLNIDVFIDRGDSSSYEKHIKLSEVKSLEGLENYGGGFYKIKED